MKYMFCLLSMLVVTSIGKAQTLSSQRPGISYQALILKPEQQLPGYNNSDVPLNDSDICLQFSITNANGAIDYQESQQLRTDRFGMINTIIGRGQIQQGGWQTIEWGESIKFLRVDVNFDGLCANYTLLTIEELTAVPYALNAVGSNEPGPRGDSAYQVWLDNGNLGSEEDFFKTLQGESGPSAYQVWLDNGNLGTEEDFLASLQGENGDSAYQAWLALGNEGTEEEFIESLQGDQGESGTSAYQEWIGLGNEGSPEDFMASLQGINGDSGLSAYQSWLNLGNTGTEEDFIDSLQGEDASANLPDGNNTGDQLYWIWDGTTWVKQIINGVGNSIQLISSVNSTNQIVCEFSSINQIRYALSGTSTNVSVNGLPSGVNSRIVNDTLYIEGSSTLDITEQTKFIYLIQSLGSDGTQKSGSITLNPSSTVTLTSGTLSQNSCLGQAISPVEFTLSGSAPNANVSGLPLGVSASISGNTVTISGTPSASIADGSIFDYRVQSFSESCDPVTVIGQLIVSDCSSCDPNANAGSNGIVCFGNSFSPGSSASNYTSLLWTTSGGGYFDNPLSPTPTYFPNSADQSAGTVILTITAQNTNCVTPQSIISSVTLSVVDCGSVSATLINNDICRVFNNSLTFGAEISTPNIGAIIAAGICYNTSGFPTIADTNVRLANSGTGDWAASPPTFEASLTNLPLNVPIYVRTYCETINGDIIYGDQIDVVSTNPNLNHIFNFTTVSGNFNINNYPVTVISELTFKRISKLNSFSWTSTGIETRDITKINFPVLDTIVGNFRLINEFSIETLNAPELIKIGGYLELNNTSMENLILPKLIESSYFNVRTNSSLDSLNLNKFQKTTNSGYSRGIAIISNGLEHIKMPSLKETNRIEISNNNVLSTIRFDSLVKTNNLFQVYRNVLLTRLAAPQIFETGSDGIRSQSLSIYENHLLSSIEVPSLRKVYDGLYIRNNLSLDLTTEFPCEMYVLYNDSYDCNPDNLSIGTNANNAYCFQDLSLRGDPTLATQAPVVNPSAPPGVLQYIVDVNLTRGSNSYVVFEERGVLYSTTPSPTYDGDNSVDPYFENYCGTGNDSLCSQTITLNPSTTYYIRGYVKDCNSVYYGNTIPFTTP